MATKTRAKGQGPRDMIMAPRSFSGTRRAFGWSFRRHSVFAVQSDELTVHAVVGDALGNYGRSSRDRTSFILCTTRRRRRTDPSTVTEESAVDQVSKLLTDFVGLWRICGASIALKWLFSVVVRFGPILKQGNLKPADRAMGDGPFEVRFPRAHSSFRIEGLEAMSGIREMYVRDVYLGGGILKIADGDTVVDLGGNMGNFTNLALAHGENVRVVTVEPNPRLIDNFELSVGLNAGHRERATLLRGFVGSLPEDLKPGADMAPLISEDELIERGKLTHIDFLKCDVEGGEFGLLTRDSKLLAMAQFLGIEIHAFAGDVRHFMSEVEKSGFQFVKVKWDPDGTCTALAKHV